VRPVTTLDMTSQNIAQTFRLGRQLGELLAAGDVVCLSGNLGAGKTVFTKGIGEGWGAQEGVTSPTFTLIHEHRRQQDGQVLYHIDCYRLQSARDAWGIGLDELLNGAGVAVIEWPENISDVLPEERLWITLSILDDNQRQLALEASGERYVSLLEIFRLKAVGD